MLDDLLDLARVTSGRIAVRREPVDLRAAVDMAVEGQRPAIEARAQGLTVAVPEEAVIVHGDPARLQQVLANLLNNASKFTPAGGVLGVGLGTDSGEAVLRVWDSGSGIPPDKLDYIFELFAQVNPTLAHTEGGLGIGLALVKRVVELHGGRVRASSEGPGRGAEFEVRLPLTGRAGCGPTPRAPRPVRWPGAAWSSSRTTTTRGRCCWPRSRSRATRSPGRRRGRRAFSSPSGRQAVLVDLGLPDIDGYEVCRRLRATFRPGPPGRALTGYGQPQDRERTASAGFDAHLIKPVDPATVSRMLA